jgi:hypothetical protein
MLTIRNACRFSEAILVQISKENTKDFHYRIKKIARAAFANCTPADQLGGVHPDLHCPAFFAFRVCLHATAWVSNPVVKTSNGPVRGHTGKPRSVNSAAIKWKCAQKSPVIGFSFKMGLH